MRKILMCLTIALLSVKLMAQKPFKASLYCKEAELSLVIDLYEESINVPGMEMFGPMHGFLKGNIYGIWSITSAKIINEQSAVIRLSNDQGSETQEVELTIQNNGKYNFEQVGGVAIKKIVGRKLEKIPKSLTFERKE